MDYIETIYEYYNNVCKLAIDNYNLITKYSNKFRIKYEFEKI